MRLTVATIRALKPKDRKYYKTETGTGLAVAVYPTGQMSYVFRYTRPDGSARRTFLAIGDVDDIALADARAAASDYQKQVRAGIDPARAKELEKQERAAAPTVTALWEMFETDMAIPRGRSDRGRRTPISAKTLRDYRGYWRRGIEPEIGHMIAREVTRGDVRRLFVKASRRGPIEGNRVVGLVRRLYNYALYDQDHWGRIETNPALRMNKNDEYPCDRVLTAKELRQSWVGMGEAPSELAGERFINDKQATAFRLVGLALRMILVTMQRGIDVRLMQDEHLDEEERSWTIGQRIYKTGKPHRVPLTALALDIIQRARALRPAGCPYVFGSPLTGVPFPGETLSERVRENLDRWQVAPFTPHDLRRTASTLANSAGADPAHTDYLQGHYPIGIRRVYDLYAYDIEKRVVAELWESKLRAIIEGRDQKVVALRTRERRV